MRKSIVKGLLAAGCLVAANAAFAVTPSASMLGNTCSGCHGPNGSSQGPATPNLAGISEAYMIDTMKGYKEGDRFSTIMGRIAKGYTDEEIELMAKHFAGLKLNPIAQKHDAGLAKKGKKLHEKYCEKCHEDGGSSQEDDSGILASQMTPYLRNTFADYKNGDRPITEKKMKKKMKQLQDKEGDAGVEALINYYASQK
jgi:cytochrome subunit of sulfide dehydrogenase